MAVQVSCPQCERSLAVPDSLIGKGVKCPGCGTLFQAAEGGVALPMPVPPPAPPPPAPEPAAAPPPPAPAKQVPCPYCAELIASDVQRCPFCGEATDDEEDGYDDRPRRGRYRRRDVEPHRGNSIKVLGIISLVAIPGMLIGGLLATVVGLVLGGIAWGMASKDLPKIRRGEMDPEGETPTQTGKTCGMIGVIIHTILLIACLGFLVFFVFMRMMGERW